MCTPFQMNVLGRNRKKRVLLVMKRLVMVRDIFRMGGVM